MTADDREPRSRLSNAGRAALDEYLSAERSRILTEATRLSDGGLLSAFDIVNAIDLIKARYSRPQVDSSRRVDLVRALRPGFSPWVAATAAMLTILGLLIAVVPTVVNKPEPPASSILVAVITISVGAAVATIVLVLIMSVRSYQRASRRDQELLEVEAAVFEAHRQKQTIDGLVDRRTDQGRESWMLRTREEREKGAFIARWIVVEEILRSIGSRFLGIPPMDARRYPIGELLRMLVSKGVLSDTSYQEIRDLMALRNAVLHGGKFDVGDLPQAEERLENLALQLEAHDRSAL